MIQNIRIASSKTCFVLACIITAMLASYLVGEPGNPITHWWFSRAIIWVHNHLPHMPEWVWKYGIGTIDGFCSILAFSAGLALFWLTIRYAGHIVLWSGLWFMSVISNPKNDDDTLGAEKCAMERAG